MTLWTLGRSVFAQKDPGAAFRRLRCSKIHYWDTTGVSQETRDDVARHELPIRTLPQLGHWPMMNAPSEFYDAIAADIRPALAA